MEVTRIGIKAKEYKLRIKKVSNTGLPTPDFQLTSITINQCLFHQTTNPETRIKRISNPASGMNNI